MKLSRKTFVMFVALAGGFLASRLVYSQAPATPPAEPAAATTPAADPTPAPADAAAPATPVSIPDYFDSHATDTNNDGKIDDKDPPKWPDPTGGAAGYWTTPSAPPGDGDPAAMTPSGLYDRIAHNTFSINFVWVLVCGFLVMFMQAGFAMVEGGLCRAKNSSHTFAMNFMVYPLGCLAFYVYGFALGWGNWYNGPVAPGWYSALGPGTVVLNQGIGIGGDPSTPNVYKYGLAGTKGWCLAGMDDVSVMALFFFMMVFMDTTATIPTGSMAERWAWKNFVIYALWVALPYCLFANWVWGGGWLAQMGKNWNFGHGAVDFAGSAVVHTMGGFLALAGAIVIGPRIGKYIDGKPQAIPGHSLPMALIGTFILAFGWFGFNPGSTLSGTDLRIAQVVVNTMLASIAGGIATMLYLMGTGKKPDPSMMLNGFLAGLVAVTCPCAFIDSWAALLIGAIAGVLVVWAVLFFDNAGVDDPVGAVSVHGINGVWGVISLGIFANGKYGAGWNGVVRPEMVEKYGFDGVRGALFGDVSQLWAQLITAGVAALFAFVMGYAWFKFSNLITPLRVSKEIEIQGLDIPEMGAMGYPDFVYASGHGK